MFEVGRVCMKIAGRDAGKYCIIIDKINNNYVMIDGQTRRRKCNIKHLEPTLKTVKIDKGASHDSVVKALKKINIEVKERVRRGKGSKGDKISKQKTSDNKKDKDKNKQASSKVSKETKKANTEKKKSSKTSKSKKSSSGSTTKSKSSKSNKK